jgi:hypothetical protein
MLSNLSEHTAAQACVPEIVNVSAQGMHILPNHMMITYQKHAFELLSEVDGTSADDVRGKASGRQRCYMATITSISLPITLRMQELSSRR